MMNLDTQRWLILSIWLLALAINVAMLFWIDSTQYQSVESSPEGWREPINALYVSMFGLYGAPLTTMFAIAFTKSPPLTVITPRPIAFGLALVGSLFWNAIIVWLTVRMSIQHQLDIQSLAGLLPSFGVSMAFLINPILAYYFKDQP